MLFEDIFYPGNPQRRQDVTDLSAEIRASFKSFRETWKECAELLNPIISSKFPDATLLPLDYNESKDDIEEIVKKINFVINDIKPKWEKMAKDARLPVDLPLDGAELDEVQAKLLIQFLLPNAAGTLVGVFAGIYINRAIQIIGMIVRAVGGSLSWVATYLGGALGGLILGGVGFVVTDAIVDAIVGAIRRNELDTQISALKELKANVTDPLNKSRDRLRGIMQAVNDGVYKISDQYIIVRKEDGTYDMIKIGKISTATAVMTPLAAPLRVRHGGDNHSLGDYMIVGGSDIAQASIARMLDSQRQIDRLLA